MLLKILQQWLQSPIKKEVIFVTSPANSNDSVVIASVAGYKDSSIYNVTVLEQDVITIDSLDFFNAADVIIMGRSINSGNVGAARAAWDSISAPVISTNMWGLRGRTDKAAWTPAYNCDNVAEADTSILKAIITYASDPVFDGISTDTMEWWSGNYSAFRADNEGDDAGNGLLLAETADKRPLFIRWAANVEFYEAAGHAPKGDRTFIGCGSDNGGTVNYFAFSAEAKTVFFNELSRLAFGEETVIPKHTNADLASLETSLGELTPEFSC